MEETWRRCGEIYARLAREGPSKNKGNRTQKKSIAIYDAISSGKNWMGKWHLIQKQRTELHRKEKSLKHILVRTTPKNLKSLLDGRSPGGPSILFNSSFTSRDLHLAWSSSTLWCNKIFANWLLVGPFCWYFLSSHRLKVAFEEKSLSFAKWLLAFYMNFGTRDAIDSSRYKKISQGSCEKPLK